MLQAWDDEIADRVFTANVDLDRPRPARRADIARVRERIGEFQRDPDRTEESESPAHCRWWLTGEHGTVSVQIRLAPLREPLVQQLVLAVPPAPDSALGAAVGLLTAALGESVPTWPPGLATDSGLAVGPVLRRLRTAAAWAGPSRLDCYVAGNGQTSSTVRLAGESGAVLLTVETGDAGVRQVEIALANERED